MPALTALPAPQPWRDAPPLRWGILAPGGIAEKFAQAVHRRTDHRVVAAGSRSKDRAQAFADANGVTRAYGSYAEVVADPDVDAVYVSSPHSAHAEQALLAIEAGKHVLVEKPFVTNAADAERVFAASRAAGVLAMEAMWTRYLPQASIIRQIVADGVLGEVTSVIADFGFSIPFMPEHRMYDPAQAGGALLDAGVYPVSFISSVLGTPGELTALGSVAATGVDDQAAVTLRYDGAIATARTSIRSWLPVTASIGGTNARLDVDSEFIRPSGLRLTQWTDWAPQTLTWHDEEFVDHSYDALSCQVRAFASFVDDGLLESPIHPHAEVTGIVDALDRAQRQILTAAARTASDSAS